MIYLFTALYPEAKPLIRVFSLKRVQDGLPFDVYENADTSIRLVISGTGMCAAAAATAAVFGRYRNVCRGSWYGRDVRQSISVS